MHIPTAIPLLTFLEMPYDIPEVESLLISYQHILKIVSAAQNVELLTTVGIPILENRAGNL